MQLIRNLFAGREPVMMAGGIVGILFAAMHVAGTFGLKMEPEQQLAVQELVLIIAAFVARGKVTPVKPNGPVVKRENAVMLVLAILLASCSTGCAGSFEETRASIRVGSSPPSERCMSLDSMRRDWGAVGKGAAVLAGASGIATIPVDDDRARIGLAAGSVAMGATAAVAVTIAEGAGDSWVRECSQ